MKSVCKWKTAMAYLADLVLSEVELLVVLTNVASHSFKKGLCKLVS
jgi:hypothetical protein